MQDTIDGCVSVVIPARGRLVELRRAIESVQRQTHRDLEIVVVDDGSDPPLSREALQGPASLKLVRLEQGAGAQKARLAGVRAARGGFVSLLDSDDWWSPDKLERQVATAGRYPGTLISCRVVASRPRFHKVAPWRVLALGEQVEDFLYVHRGMLQSSTVFGPRPLIESLLAETESSIVHTDTVLFLAAQARAVPILQMAEALSFFDDTPRADRISYDAGRLRAAEAWFHGASGTWSSQARSGFLLTDLVIRCVNTGHRWQAWRFLFKALSRHHPPSAYLKRAAYIVCNGSPLRIREALTSFQPLSSPRVASDE